MKNTFATKFAIAAVSAAILLGTAAPAFAEDLSVKANIRADLGAGLYGKRDDDREATGPRMHKTVLGQELAFSIRQNRVTFAAHRASAVADMLSALGVKLKARIDETKTSGKDVSAMLAAHAEMTAKAAEAKTKAQAAITAAATIKADSTDAAVLDANRAALKTAREALVAAEQALKVALRDARMIIKALAGVKAGAKATATATAFTMADVSAHASVSSCWTVVSGSVYDLTDWIGSHPGGEAAILRLCGKNGTDMFMGKHSKDMRPQSVLGSYKIGILK